jgi:hypothetical protein
MPKLKGRLRDLHSVSINISYCITIDFLIECRTIIPVAIGSHDDCRVAIQSPAPNVRSYSQKVVAQKQPRCAIL